MKRGDEEDEHNVLSCLGREERREEEVQEENEVI